MTLSFNRAHPALRRFLTVFLIAGSTLLTGCASMYVDTATKDVPVAELKKVAQPKPVQMVFEFQTKGAPNANVTKLLKDQVTEQLKVSGLFAQVSAEPQPGAAMINVTINNVPLTDNAFGKGFVTGLTFGLAGSTVSDGYVCTISYLGAGQSNPVTATAKHAIHTTLGASGAPANAIKAASGEEAARTMTRQIVGTALLDLSNNNSFN